mmetsp:Transcript_15512/g.46472  ORF Transcript_15512/g.46472 Transcript_15512/m.46472 type:complete len:352 (+) Transcript_15512:672-1727(+)
MANTLFALQCVHRTLERTCIARRRAVCCRHRSRRQLLHKPAPLTGHMSAKAPVHGACGQLPLLLQTQAKADLLGERQCVAELEAERRAGGPRALNRERTVHFTAPQKRDDDGQEARSDLGRGGRPAVAHLQTHWRQPGALSLRQWRGERRRTAQCAKEATEEFAHHGHRCSGQEGRQRVSSGQCDDASCPLGAEAQVLQRGFRRGRLKQGQIGERVSSIQATLEGERTGESSRVEGATLRTAHTVAEQACKGQSPRACSVITQVQPVLTYRQHKASLFGTDGIQRTFDRGDGQPSALQGEFTGSHPQTVGGQQEVIGSTDQCATILQRELYALLLATHQACLTGCRIEANL